MGIREMKNSELQKVLEIYEEGIKTKIATFQSEVQSVEEWDSAHLEKCRFVYEENDTIIGFVCISSVSKRLVYKGVCEVSIYISEKARGRGIGVELLTYLIYKAKKEGFYSFQSVIIGENEKSVEMHRVCGFRKIGYKERIAKDIDGKWHDVVLMEKRA